MSLLAMQASLSHRISTKISSFVFRRWTKVLRVWNSIFGWTIPLTSWSYVHCEQAYLQHVSVFACVENFSSAFLFLDVLWTFAERFCIWMCCELLQRVSVFACVVNFCSVFLYLNALWTFAAHFCICLCCELLQRVSVFACVVNFCSACVVKLMKMFSLFAGVFSICMCFLNLQRVEHRSILKQHFQNSANFSKAEVYADQTVNNFSLLSHKMHSMSTFSKIHEHLCISYFTICKTQYTIFAAHFSIANTLLSKLIKARSNQNVCKLCAFWQELYWNIKSLVQEWFEHHQHFRMVFLPAYSPLGDRKYMVATHMNSSRSCEEVEAQGWIQHSQLFFFFFYLFSAFELVFNFIKHFLQNTTHNSLWYTQKSNRKYLDFLFQTTIVSVQLHMVDVFLFFHTV